ncbi:MAG: hypothetical protein ACOVT5_01955 [Armatimonadaceae bacterium]
MSTRAVFTFSDPDHKGRPLVVYKHHDGYPSGAVGDLIRARDGGLSWPLPRFEADEFAAAFVASNKAQPGSIRLLGAGDWRDLSPGDIEYVYHVVRFPSGHINVAGWRVDEDEKGRLSMGEPVLQPTRLRDLGPAALAALRGVA